MVDNPTHGIVTGNAPTLTYHPETGYQGPDSFTFKTSDGQRDSATATVSITVGDEPVADDQIVETCRNVAKQITLTGSGVCGSLNFTKLTDPTHGTLSGAAANYSYQPGAGYEGPDSFTFKVNNGFQDSPAATVSIVVGYQPVADSQARVTHLGRAINITLTGSDQCYDPLTYMRLSNPTLGTVSGTAPNLTFTPSTPGTGDGFTFKVNDGVRDSLPANVSLDVLQGPALAAIGICAGIYLEWTVPDWVEPFVNDYVIYRATTPGGYGSPLATLPGSSRSFLDSSVSSGVTYYYVVRFHYADPGVATDPEAPSNEVSAQAGGVGPHEAAMDFALILDNTGSMGTEFLNNFRNNIKEILDCIESYTLGDYRLALVTPDNDQVHVRVPFAQNNRAGFVAGLNQNLGVSGIDFPESTDECLNTILNALIASGRSNPDSALCQPTTTLQIGDFTPGFRSYATKFVVMITDEAPGGFCDTTHLNHAHDYAQQARSGCVRINAIHVAEPSGTWDPTADMVMRDYYQTTCGWHSLSPHDGGGTAIVGAVLKMLYQNGYCTCQ